MAVLKFRVYIEEDNSVYRDIAIKTTQNFLELHLSILHAYGFDQKHQATFYRSNEGWQRGREISLEAYDKSYRSAPLIMSDTLIGSEIKSTNQHFIYEYDFIKGWVFLIELINVSKEENSKQVYPIVTRTEGIGPQQYGITNILSNQFVDIEEKYDLNKNEEGFGREGEENLDEDDGFDVEENEQQDDV